ncbi:MAG: DUF4351 domain-containing protein [Cyanobacteria bacterium P01_F01_bin.150]
MVNYPSFQLLRTISSDNPSGSLAIDRDSQWLISATCNRCQIWQIQTGDLLHTLEEVPQNLQGVLLSADEKTLYGFGMSELYFWDFPQLTLRLKTDMSPAESYVSKIEPHGIGGSDILDPEDERLKEGVIKAVVEDIHSQKLYLARSNRGDRCHWDLRSNRWIEHGLASQRIAISRDTKTVVAAGGEGAVMVWQLSNTGKISYGEPGYLGLDGYPERSFWSYWLHVDKRSKSKGRYRAVSTLEVSNDGQIAYFGYYNGQIELWRVDTFHSVGLLKGHGDSIRKMAVSPDGQVLASADHKGWMKLWDLSTHSELLSIEAHDNGIRDLKFSADGELLASCGIDKTIKLWGEEVVWSRRRDRQIPDPSQRRETTADPAIKSGLIHGPETLQDRFREDWLEAYSFYQLILQKGIKEGCQETVLILLRQKLGPLSLETEAKIYHLSLTQLTALLEVMLNFQQPQDLTKWLASITQ